MPDLFDGPLLADRYSLGRLLGRGMAGDVRLARDEHLGRTVAVKLLIPSTEGDLADPIRFRAEAIAAARVSSPYVVSVLDIGEHEGNPFLVMEALSGLTWADELRASRPADARVFAVVDDVLCGLAAVHAAGVVHRDVKPSNVLLRDNGRAQLGDFGIAQAVDLAGITLPGTVVGSFGYVAPERLYGEIATPASDVWSAGVLLYESLAGRRPFGGDAPLTVAAAVQRGTHPPLQSLRPDLPEAICSAVEAALSADPAARPSAVTLRTSLAADNPETAKHDRDGDAAVPLHSPRVAGAVELLAQWLTPPDADLTVAIKQSRGHRARAWAAPGLVLAAAAAAILVMAGGSGTGGPGDPTPASRAEAAAPITPSVAEPDPTPSAQLAGSPPGTELDPASARGSAATPVSGTSEAITGRQGPASLDREPKDHAGKADKGKGKEKKHKGGKKKKA
jgi:serine/threonine-protein kinase